MICFVRIYEVSYEKRKREKAGILAETRKSN